MRTYMIWDLHGWVQRDLPPTDRNGESSSPDVPAGTGGTKVYGKVFTLCIASLARVGVRGARSSVRVAAERPGDRVRRPVRHRQRAQYRAHHLPGGVVVRPSAPYPRGTYSYLSIARTTYLVVWWYDRAHRTDAAPTRTSVSRAPPT